MRAARFGVPLVQPVAAGDDLERIKKRQERFGVRTAEEAKAPKAALSAEEQAKIEERKKRFGEVVTDAAGGGKRAKADAPGGAATQKPAAQPAAEPEMSAEMKAKLEARANRFGKPAAPAP